MTGPFFVDSNVLIYRYDSAVPEKQVLLTEDLQHGQSFEGVVVVNPFLEVPPEPKS